MFIPPQLHNSLTQFHSESFYGDLALNVWSARYLSKFSCGVLDIFPNFQSRFISLDVFMQVLIIVFQGNPFCFLVHVVRRTNTTKLTGTFRDYVHAPKMYDNKYRRKTIRQYRATSPDDTTSYR